MPHLTLTLTLNLTLTLTLTLTLNLTLTQGDLGDTLTYRLRIEQRERAAQLLELSAITRQLQHTCWPGCSAEVLTTALVSLRALQQNIQVLRDIGRYREI